MAVNTFNTESGNFLGENLRRIRGDASQAVFAERLGIKNQVTYHRYEHGRVPRRRELERIAEVIGITGAELLGQLGDSRIAEISSRLSGPKLEIRMESPVSSRWLDDLISQFRSPLTDEELAAGKSSFPITQGFVLEKPAGFPDKIELVRPVTSELALALFNAVEKRDLKCILLRCLPSEKNPDQLVESLNPFCFIAILTHAFRLCFGREEGDKQLSKLSVHYSQQFLKPADGSSG